MMDCLASENFRYAYVYLFTGIYICMYHFQKKEKKEKKSMYACIVMSMILTAGRKYRRRCCLGKSKGDIQCR